MVDMFVVVSMLTGPEQNGVLECAGTENEREEFYHPVSLEAHVRKQPVITQSDRKTARKEHHQEKDDLESVNPEKPQIGRDCRKREKQCANQERTYEPIDLLEGYS